MIITHFSYSCPKCKKCYFYKDNEKFPTKCPKCKIELELWDTFKEDTEYIPPSDEPKITIHEIKAQLEGRPAIQCPTCGSYHTNKLTGVERAVSFGIFGFASNKIGKSFECKNCGYKW